MAGAVIGVILNPHAGYVARHGIARVRALVTAAVPDARIHVLVAGDDVGARCRAFRADGAACIVAAGGDGTVGSVAAHLVGTGTPLGVLPVGTLNHFARDVGVGRDVPAAARALADGCTRIVDAAEVNSHLFVNNSSIGLYAHLVEARERHERQWGKWRALVRAALLSLREGRPLPVRVTADGATGMAETYLLFVGHNRYDLDLLRAGRRAALDAGELSVFALVETRRLRLVPHFLRALRCGCPRRWCIAPGRARCGSSCHDTATPCAPHDTAHRAAALVSPRSSLGHSEVAPVPGSVCRRPASSRSACRPGLIPRSRGIASRESGCSCGARALLGTLLGRCGATMGVRCPNQTL
jgi:diacylglycerol kinase family enzyme